MDALVRPICGVRYHYDVHIKMVDVWENRQFMALQSAFGRTRGRVGGRNAAAGGSKSSTSTERVDVRGALRPSRPRVRRRPAGGPVKVS